jgi:hypothetical protein
VTLDLLKYGDAGEQSYRAYSGALEDYLPSIGVEVLYVGDCSTSPDRVSRAPGLAAAVPASGHKRY